MNIKEKLFREQKYSDNGKEAYCHLNEMLQNESKAIPVEGKKTQGMGSVGPN